MGKKENTQISATINTPLRNNIQNLSIVENRTFSSMVEVLLSEALNKREIPIKKNPFNHSKK